jgi:hypothetical protein
LLYLNLNCVELEFLIILIRLSPAEIGDGLKGAETIRKMGQGLMGVSEDESESDGGW